MLFWIQALLLAPSFSQADPLSRWTWRNPLPQGYILNGLTHANGKFIAVGDQNTIVVSTNGNQWSVVRTGIPGDLFGVTYGNGTYVSVGGWGNILISTNGEDWEAAPSAAAPLFGVTFGAGIFVGVGGEGTIITSTNGREWKSLAVGAQAFGAVAYGNGVYFARGPSHGIATSSDSKNWAFQPAECWSVGAAAYANGLYIATGSYFVVNGNEWNVTAGLLTSANATNWVRQSLASGHAITGLTYGKGQFVAVDDWGGVQVSTNGTNWTFVRTISPNVLNAVAFGNDTFVAVGRTGVILSSTNTQNWEIQRIGPTTTFSDGVFAKEKFVLTSDVPNSLVKSSDGISWEVQTLSENVRAITFGMDLFVAVGTGGAIYTSQDADHWEKRISPSQSTISEIVFGNGTFLALTFDGSILRSSNAVEWESRYLGCCAYRLGFGNGLFVIGGGGLGYTSIATSADGIQWTGRLGGTTNSQSGTVSAIEFGNGRFLVQANSLLYSDDGIEWNRADLSSPVSGISFGNGVFIGIQDGYIVTSRDGLDWAKRDLSLSGVGKFLYGGGKFLAIGFAGYIFQSDDMAHLLGIQNLGEDRFVITLDGLRQFNYTVQSSMDLQNWSTLTTLTNLQREAVLETTNAPRSGTQYFRTVVQ